MKTINLFGILCLITLLFMNSCTEETFEPQESADDILKSRFKDFKVIELDAKQIAQDLQNQPGQVKNLILVPGEIEYEVSSTAYLPNLELIDENDNFLTHNGDDLIIYDNLKLDHEKGDFSMIIEGDEIQVEFTKNGSIYSIQPLTDFVKTASSNQYIVYKGEDVLDKSIPYGALMEMMEEDEYDDIYDEFYRNRNNYPGDTLYIADINSFVFNASASRLGGRDQASNYIRRIFYIANLKFLRGRIPFEIRTARIRFMRIGRYGITHRNDSISVQKVIFRDAINNQIHLKNDLNILWTVGPESMFPGSSYVKRICGNPNNGRGNNFVALKVIPDNSQRHFRTNFAIHEIAHQIGGRHGGVPPASGGYIFRPTNLPSKFSEINTIRINGTFASDSLNTACLEKVLLN